LSHHPEVSFTIRTTDGQQVFRQGEAVSIELVFAASAPDEYRLNNVRSDRSGRLGIDEMSLSPMGGVDDPLADYYGAGVFGFIGGGISVVPTLDEEPSVIPYELNEWFRFDKPGVYRLVITSNRVSRKRSRGKDGESELPLRLASNPVSFRIVPADPSWQSRELSEILGTLETSETEQAQRKAARRLRYLGTHAAVLEMLRRWGRGASHLDHYFHFGLIGSPHRQFVVEQLDAGLALPDQQVTLRYLQALALLRFVQRHPSAVARAGRVQSEESTTTAMSHQDRRARYNALLRSVADRLRASLRHKSGVALAISTDALAGLGAWQDPEGRPVWSATDLGVHLAPVFIELPRKRQEELLRHQWDRIADSAFLPVLREIHENPASSMLRSPNSLPERRFRGIVLQRIYDLAPGEGRRLILEEIHKIDPSVDSEALLVLPDQSLPELDSELAERLSNSEIIEHLESVEGTTRLIQRYASERILLKVRAYYSERKGRLACSIQSALLAYFLHVDSELGIETIREATKMRGPEQTGCYRSVLEQVVRLEEHPALEEIAVDLLWDDDVEVASSAVAWLGRYGTQEGERALWHRFEAWSAQWRGKASDLRDERERVDLAEWPGRMEQALVNAMISSQRWETDAVRVRQIESLCVTRPCLEQVRRYIQP